MISSFLNNIQSPVTSRPRAMSGVEIQKTLVPQNSASQVNTTNEAHFADINLSVSELPDKIISNHPEQLGQTLGDGVMSALKNVNQEIVYSDELVDKMITKPNTVDVHDVSIALQKADLSLSLTKGIIQRAISSYQSLLNLR